MSNSAPARGFIIPLSCAGRDDRPPRRKRERTVKNSIDDTGVTISLIDRGTVKTILTP
jgi:hypothetical protein